MAIVLLLEIAAIHRKPQARRKGARYAFWY